MKMDSLIKKVRGALKTLNSDIPRYVGKAAVDIFDANFDKQGFDNGGVTAWKDVKRRDPNSKWHGFEYKGERTTYKLKKKRGKKGYENGGKTKINFSVAATKRAILHGSTSELRRSLKYNIEKGKVTVSSDKPYAALQNDGGPMKVFGRSGPIMPARPFVGESKELNEEIERITDREVNKIFTNLQ